MEEVDVFKPVILGNARDLDKLTDLLDLLEINLKEANHSLNWGNFKHSAQCRVHYLLLLSGFTSWQRYCMALDRFITDMWCTLCLC